VLEGVDVEVRAELAVEHVQQIEVELCRNTRAVVVGGLDHARLLDEVSAEQQVAVVAERLRQRAQEAPPAAGREVADRAAEKGDEAGAGGCRQVPEVALEVADDAVHREPRILLDEELGDGMDRGRADVDGDVARERAGGGHRVEQHARLLRRARSQLDELDGARARDDVVGVHLEDQPLRARLVVLGQLADVVEELRAARIVEVLGRQLLQRAGEPVEDVVGEGALVVRTEMRTDLDTALEDRLHHVTSFVSRKRQMALSSRM